MMSVKKVVSGQYTNMSPISTVLFKSVAHHHITSNQTEPVVKPSPKAPHRGVELV